MLHEFLWIIDILQVHVVLLEVKKSTIFLCPRFQSLQTCTVMRVHDQSIVVQSIVSLNC